MWIDTAVVDAKPVIVFAGLAAGITCFISNPTTELAARLTAGIITMPSRAMVAVDAEVAALANTMLVTTATLDVFGAVYSVAEDVAAAVLASALLVVAISYYIPFCLFVRIVKVLLRLR